MSKHKLSFCGRCGGKNSQIIPEGDNRLRAVCDVCGDIQYQNPRIITGCLPIYQQQVLLCKRAIEPRKGLWTLPGGFMELGETMAEGARRETWEEACARVSIRQLYTSFDVIHTGHVSLFFLADLDKPEFAAGLESEDVQLFSESQIPWEALAFSTITKTLQHYFKDRVANNYPLHRETILPSSRYS